MFNINASKENIKASIDSKIESAKKSDILLIDDIKTTGATVSECGKMLYLAGAKEVCVLSCAVTRKRNKDRER